MARVVHSLNFALDIIREQVHLKINVPVFIHFSCKRKVTRKVEVKNFKTLFYWTRGRIRSWAGQNGTTTPHRAWVFMYLWAWKRRHRVLIPAHTWQWVGYDPATFPGGGTDSPTTEPVKMQIVEYTGTGTLCIMGNSTVCAQEKFFSLDIRWFELCKIRLSVSPSIYSCTLPVFNNI